MRSMSWLNLEFGSYVSDTMLAVCRERQIVRTNENEKHLPVGDAADINLVEKLYRGSAKTGQKISRLHWLHDASNMNLPCRGFQKVAVQLQSRV